MSPGSAGTAPDHAEESLRGRTYAISFDRVWNAAMELADGGLRGWKVTGSDDGDGWIEAEAKTLVLRFVDDVRIDIGLDENAQTRVDARSASRKGVTDFGTNRRRLARFFRKLDRKLDATPAEILAVSGGTERAEPAPAEAPDEAEEGAGR